MRAAALLLLLPALALAAPAQDLITSLPGWNGPTPTPQYSGYLTVDANAGRYLHYWFVQSANNPATDPLVLWFNGGPGCSSLDGFFYEHGPFHFQDPEQTTGLPTLVENPNAWNKIANVLFIEAPAGVGFSYSNNKLDYFTNDNKTASDNLQALLYFLKVFPEYANSDVYISGESYAGIYVPSLAWWVHDYNAQATSNKINLKGILVGNGCTGNSVGICSPAGTQYSINFLFGHGLYSQALHKQIVAACPDAANPSAQCQRLLSQMANEVGHVNIYNIYDVCINSNGANARTHLTQSKNHVHLAFQQLAAERALLRETDNLGGPDECIDGGAAGAYLNNADVQKAIHVRTDLPRWTICTSNIIYTSNLESLLPIYRDILIPNYRVLIYNGDVDACVPYNDNESWTASLGIGPVKGWHQWTVNDQVAGYATNYNANFTFITVKGAGHMVPQYRPVEGFAMLKRFLANTPF